MGAMTVATVVSGVIKSNRRTKIINLYRKSVIRFILFLCEKREISKVETLNGKIQCDVQLIRQTFEL